MAGTDDDLLARLNALKKSNISLDDKPSVAGEPAEDLAQRFLRLHSVSPRSSEPRSTHQVDEDLKPEPRSEDDKTVEELLAELGTEDWSLNPEDPDDISHLLNESKKALPDEEDSKPSSPDRVDIHPSDLVKASETDEREPSGGDKQAEAADYLQRILDELKTEKTIPGEDPEEPDQPAIDQDGGSPPLELPSAPQFDPFADSGELQLPSAPTAAPTAKKPKPTLPKFTDEEIDTWCIICNDDATVKCNGCDGDLYCAKCWKEGHVGPEVGYEERLHRWTKYERNKT